MIDRGCISLNNNCNLRCRYCHFLDKQLDFNCFKEVQVLEIINNIHIYCKKNKLNVFKLGIVGAGEPMLKKDLIFSALDYIKSNNYSEFKLYVITNGTILSQEDIKKFYDYREWIKVCISLDGYEEIHNYGRSKFSAVMNSIENYKTVFGVSPCINATVNALSIKNKERLISFYKENDLLEVNFSKLVGYFEKDLYISDKEFGDFINYVKKSGLESRQFREEKTYDCVMYGRFCGVGRTNIFFTPEGIYPCGRFYKNDNYLLGNYNTDLFEIEKTLKSIVPVEEGKCYYVQHEEGSV